DVLAPLDLAVVADERAACGVALGMREGRGACLARICERACRIPARETREGEALEHAHGVRMGLAARLLVDGERAPIGLLGLGRAARVLEQLALAQQNRGEEAVVRPERLAEDVAGALELRLRLRIAALAVIGDAELAQHLRGVGMLGPERALDDRKRALREGLDVGETLLA